MENLELSFFLKAFVFRLKALVVRFLPLLALLMLALGFPMEGTLMGTRWHALVNGLLEGPAFAFLLLNCLIVTIIASSKLEGEKREHIEESKGLETMGQFNEKGCEKGDLLKENVTGELASHTSTPKGYDCPGSIRNNEERIYQNINSNCCCENSGLHEEESHRELATGLIEKLGDEKREMFAVENVIEHGGSHYKETPLKNSYDVHSKNKNNGASYPRRSRSLNAKPYDYKPKQEQLKTSYVSEKKPIRISRDMLASRRNEKVRLHSSKPLMTSDMERTQLITRDSLVSREAVSHPDQKPALQNSFDTSADEKCVKGLGRAVNFVDNPAPPPAATAHPSMEEVWAAICMRSNKRDDCTPSNMQAEKRSNEELNSQNVKKPQLAAAPATPTQPVAAAAAALAPPAADLGTRPPKVAAAAAASTSRRAAKAAPPNFPAGKAPVAAATEEGRELEELNRRAEKYIARVNGQMRLQREESLQRQKRGRRTCNYERSYALQLPDRGLLVG